MPIIGLDNWGVGFYNLTPSLTKIEYIDLQNSIVDELSIRERTDIPITTNKDTWEIDTTLIAQFVSSLEAGNIQSNGLQITKFAIKRRNADELKNTTIGYMDFVDNKTTLEYKDYTQGAGSYIYSIVPITESQLESVPSEVEVKSEFTGWFIVDKDTNNIQKFDTFIDSEPSVGVQLNQGRTIIETLNKFAHVYYDEREYHIFSLNTILFADEFTNVGKQYQDFLNNFVRPHKAMIVKSGSGQIYICDINQPQTSQPLNTWTDREYCEITINLQEIMNYEDYMVGV